jgi:uncharacterized protein YyaL (SSP411 family)
VVLAYAEDHAALLHALVTLAELDDPAWLDEARAGGQGVVGRRRAVLDVLGSDDQGLGILTGGEHAAAIVVGEEVVQGVTDRARLRLAALTGDPRAEEAAVGWLRAMAPLLEQHPLAFPALLGALNRWLAPPLEVVVIGDRADLQTAALWRETTSRLMPGIVKLRTTPDADPHGSPLLADRALLDGRPTAYVCERFACRVPVNEASELRAQLDEVLARS